MKANKPLKEAILRAPESTDENKQPQQEQLYHLGSQATGSTTTQQSPEQDLINEKPINVMGSLHQLRQLEYEVEKKKAGKEQK